MRLSQVLRAACLSALAAATIYSTARATEVFNCDFESGIPAEITAPGSVLSGVQGYNGLGPVGNKFSGGFLRYTSVPLHDTRLVVRNLPAHNRVSLGFLLGIIDSWDGTELFQVVVQDTMRFSYWFYLAVGDSSNYIAPPNCLLSRGIDLGFSGCCYYNRDRAYDMGADPRFQDIPHTADSLVVVWKLSAISGPAAAQWQGGADESWAIDNVRVSVSTAASAAPDASARKLALRGPRISPSRSGRLEVGVTLPRAGTAELDVLDPEGRRIATSAVGSMGAGEHFVDAAAGKRLASGMYFVRLRQGGETRVIRAVVVR